MTSVVDLIEFVEPLRAHADCAGIAARFAEQPDCDVLVVADAGRPLGVITRAAMRGRDAAQTAEAIMSPVRIVDHNATIEGARDWLASAPEPAAGLIVTEDGLYTGHVSARALLRAAKADETVEDQSLRFARMVGHALRAPLNGVLAVAELLQRQPLSVDSKAYVRTILESGQAALLALKDAQDLARADGVLALEPRPVQLRAFMDALAGAWESRAAQDGVTVMVAYDGEPDLSAETDPARLRQVFDALIETTLRINRRGVVEVSLQAIRAPDGLRLIGRVRDTGGGLAAIKLDDADEGSGVALGLRVLERMGGAARVDRNAGAGSTILFEYPAAVAVDEAEANLPGGGVLKQSAHVLVVDDNATNRMVAEALCEMFDCTSECVVDGVEAVEAAQSGRFDLILMDIRMPRMDGVEATRAIRALPGPTGQIPIIALTANADPDDAQSYIAAGMQSVVEKPLKPEQLLQAINAVLTDGPGRAAAA